MQLNKHIPSQELPSQSYINQKTQVFSSQIHSILQENEIFPGITSYDLARWLGNLFYDALWEFLDHLEKHLPDQKNTFQEARLHIEKAWKLCKGKDENHPKHARHVPGVTQSLEEISEHIAKNLSESKQQEFFMHFSQKLERDGRGDEKRGRIQLAQALFHASECLQTLTPITPPSGDIKNPFTFQKKSI